MGEKNYLIEIKMCITVLCTALTSWLGALAVPVYMLVALNIADYITGLTAAPYRGDKRSSEKGYRGIAKKVSMWILVGVGAAIDWLLAYTANTVGVQLILNYPAGAAVAIWLICNEIVSILENIGDIGVKLPSFLTQLVQWVAKETQQKVTAAEGTMSDETEINTSHK